jgi:hypothetical protein
MDAATNSVLTMLDGYVLEQAGKRITGEPKRDNYQVRPIAGVEPKHAPHVVVQALSQAYGNAAFTYVAKPVEEKGSRGDAETAEVTGGQKPEVGGQKPEVGDQSSAPLRERFGEDGARGDAETAGKKTGKRK